MDKFFQDNNLNPLKMQTLKPNDIEMLYEEYRNQPYVKDDLDRQKNKPEKKD